MSPSHSPSLIAPSSEATLPSAPASAQAAAPLAAQPHLVLCDECDAVHARMSLTRGHVARCRRCNALLGRGHVVTPNGQFAFALAALVFLLIGNFAPLVTLELRGIRLAVTLPDAIGLTWQMGQPLVALLAAVTAVVFPLLMIVLRIYVLGVMSLGLLPPAFKAVMRTLRILSDWSMVEVFLLSALVSIARSAGLASVIPGVGLMAYGALTLLLTSIAAAGLHTLWKRCSDLGAG